MTQVFAEQLPGYGPPTPVPVFQWEREFQEALDLYRQRQPKRVLEIGTYHGGTLYHWLQNATDGALVVSVDSYAVGVDNRHLYGGWVPEEVELVTLQGDSRAPETVAEVAEWAPFDWIFIDAGHYYDEVCDDWRNYGALAANGACVLFHDILPATANHPEIEVAQLWEEIKAEHMTIEIVQNAKADWGGIGVVLL